MAHMMPRYLAQRAKRLLDVYHILPDCVNLMMDYLCAELGISTTRDREVCLSHLCEGIVEIYGCKEMSVLLWGRMGLIYRKFSDLTLDGAEARIREQDKLMATTAVRSYSLVSTVLSPSSSETISLSNFIWTFYHTYQSMLTRYGLHFHSRRQSSWR